MIGHSIIIIINIICVSLTEISAYGVCVVSVSVIATTMELSVNFDIINESN